MKKNYKKRAISTLSMIAMMFTLIPVTGNAADVPTGKSVSAQDVAPQSTGEGTVISTTATAYNPIDKVIFTERSDGRYDVQVHFDKNVYNNASYSVINSWVVKDIVSGTAQGTKARTLTGWDDDTVQKNNYTMRISSSEWKSSSVAPGETIKLGAGAYNGQELSADKTTWNQKYVYGVTGDSKLIEAAKNFTAPSNVVTPTPSPEPIPSPESTPSPEPAPSQKVDLFDKVTGYTYDLSGKNKSIYMDVKAKSRPEKGERLWIYNKSDGKLYGDSSTDTISAIISRENKNGSTENDFDLGEKKCQWIIVSAPDVATAKSEAEKATPNGNGTMTMLSRAQIINVRMPGSAGRLDYSSSRYDQIGLRVNATASYNPPDRIEIRNFNKTTGAESTLKTFSFGVDDQKQEGSCTVSNLAPGSTRYYTIYVSSIVGGQLYTRHDGTYYTVKSAAFKKASVSPVKMTSKKAKIVVNVPGTQAAKGLSTMYVYKGNKKIKTLKSNGKTSIAFTYKGSKASASSYKVKSVCAKKTSVSNVSAAKKPYANTYKVPGHINGNIGSITRYGTACFEPWQVTYYNSKVTVTGYVVNNRIFKLKSCKVKMIVYNNGKKVGTKTVTYKNTKPNAIRKVSFTMSTKSSPDFRNQLTTWNCKMLSAKW